MVGHRDVPGRPAMYATTRQFLDYFNLKNLDQLPALAEIRDLDTLNAELGFSEPATAPGESPDGPGLTVVGGTDHIPAAGAAEAPTGGAEADAGPQLEPDSAEALADAVDAMNAAAPETEAGTDDGTPSDLDAAKPESQA